MSQKIRTAVIGAGWWSTAHHIPGLLAHPDAELVAVCDPHEERLANAVQAFELQKTYRDYREMLEKETLDAAIIVTPHATHFEIARDCLQKNLHLLIEKPMTLFARDARELLLMAEEHSLQIALGYAYLYFQHAERAKAALSSGQLGEIQYV